MKTGLGHGLPWRLTSQRFDLNVKHATKLLSLWKKINTLLSEISSDP